MPLRHLAERGVGRMSPTRVTSLSGSSAAGTRKTSSQPLPPTPTAAFSLSALNRRIPPVTTFLRSRTAGALLTAAIVGLTLATAYIHLTLGGLLFTLNGLGYVGLAALIVIGAVAPVAVVERFSWFPRLALAGYAAMTIAGYLVMGPYFTLGFIAKGIEVALIIALVIDVVRVYGSPLGMVRSALASLGPVVPDRFRPTSA
jgi:hypothetical protein